MLECSHIIVKQQLHLHNYVVDRNVYKFNEESDKSHQSKPNSSGHHDLVKLYKTQKQ